jgi:hypothetical protein
MPAGVKIKPCGRRLAGGLDPSYLITDEAGYAEFTK